MVPTLSLVAVEENNRYYQVYIVDGLDWQRRVLRGIEFNCFRSGRSSGQAYRSTEGPYIYVILIRLHGSTATVYTISIITGSNIYRHERLAGGTTYNFIHLNAGMSSGLNRMLTDRIPCVSADKIVYVVALSDPMPQYIR